jgi:hypothetical protein
MYYAFLRSLLARMMSVLTVKTRCMERIRFSVSMTQNLVIGEMTLFRGVSEILLIRGLPSQSLTLIPLTP